MRQGTCAYCGRDGTVEDDHITGRGPDGRYGYPQLTFDACPPCNKTLFHVWQVEGLDRVQVHPMATQLTRAAVAVLKVAECGHDLVLTPEQLTALAALLSDAAVVIVGLVAVVVLLVVSRVWGVLW